MAKYVTLDQVMIFGSVIHGSKDTVYEGDQIKKLVGQKAGAYGRHWVYIDQNSQGRIDMKAGHIRVIGGNEQADQAIFHGRQGLNRCLEYLDTFAK